MKPQDIIIKAGRSLCGTGALALMNISFRSSVMATFALALAAGTVKAGNLVALYRFEDSTTADVAGSLKLGEFAGLTFNGTVFGSPTLSDVVSGSNGGTGSLYVSNNNGTGNHGMGVTLPSSLSAAQPFNGDFTITSWFKIDSTNCPSGWDATILSSGNGIPSMAFYVNNDGRVVQDYWFVNGVGAGTTAHDGNWHFGAVTYDSTTQTFTVSLDNTVSATNTFGAVSYNTSAPIILGGASSDWPGTFGGNLDDVAIFKGILSSAELAAVKGGDFSAYLRSSAGTATTTRLESSLNPSDPGTPVTITATVSDGSSPSGDVRFYDAGGTVLLDTQPLTFNNVSGKYEASFTTSTLPIGTRSITAKYMGDNVNLASTSDPLFQTVTGPTPQLVALYRFEGSTTADVDGSLKLGEFAGQTFDGTVFGSPALSTEVSGSNGGTDSLYVSNNNGAGNQGMGVTLPSSLSAVQPFNGDFTITAWFKIDSANCPSGWDATILSSGSWMSTYVGGNGTLDQDYYFYNGVGGGTTAHDGNWHFGAVTYQNSAQTFTIWLDGSTVATKVFGSGKLSADANIIIGGTTQGWPGTFGGNLDDVAIFKGVLSRSEMAAVKGGDFSPYLVATTKTPYETWAGPGGYNLTGDNARMDADPDNDGQNNLMEFALNGTPNNGALNGMVYSFTDNAPTDPLDLGMGKVLVLTVAVRDNMDGDFTGSPATAVNTADGIKYTIMGGLDLNDWTGSIIVYPKEILTTGMPAAPGTGYHWQSFILNSSNDLTGKGFMRVKVEPAP